MLKIKKGMTILELMIASLILSVGLLGFTSSKMKSIFDAEYSSDMSYVTTSVSDFQSIVINDLKRVSDSEDRKNIRNYYTNADWKNINTDPDLKRCESSLEIEDLLYCDTELMRDYNIQEFKNVILKSVPSATIDFVSCNSGVSSCITVAWAGASNDIQSCKANTVSCYVVEF
tara:strand:- start:177719 stop:178237 length:519 start_codon:yes stop_codon:yes gene_type:complete